MKTFLIFLLAFYCPVLAFAQLHSADAAAELLVKAEQSIDSNADTEALEYAQRALFLIRPHPNYLIESNAYYLIGKAEWKLGAAAEAVAPLQKSLELRRRSKNDSLIINSLISLGSVMGELEYADSSLLYLHEAQDLALKRRDTLQLAKIYINLANAFDLEQEYAKAIEYNDTCEILLKNTNFEKEKGQNYYGMGDRLLNMYIKKGELNTLKRSQFCFEKAIEIFKKLGDKQSESHARNAAGTAALYFEDFSRARIELFESLKISESLNDSTGLINVYYNLATLAETEGDHSGAILYFKSLVKLMELSGTAGDAIFIREQFSNSNSKISKTLIDNKINILEGLQKNKITLLLSLAAISIMCTLIFGGIFYHRQKMRANMASRRLLLEELDNRIKTQEIEFIRARLEGEEAGRQKVVRKIHDGVGGLLISAKWNLESALDELPGGERKVVARLRENIRLQDESYQELRKVVYDLERGRIPWWEDLRRFCERLTGNKKTDIRFYTYNLDESVGGAVGEDARLITRELITNALKHAEAKTIFVQINRIDHLLSILVEDDGKGFDPENISDGVGMRSIRERTEHWNGSVSFESGMGKGTSVFVDIPLKAKQSA